MPKKIPTFSSTYFQDFLDHYEKSKSSEKRNSKSDGVIYTPLKIVSFMLNNAFFWYLRDFIPNSSLHNNPSEIIDSIKETQKKILTKKLSKIKILDPSIGTGRFLVNAADFLFNLRKNLNPSIEDYDLKKKIIEKNIFGNEIDNESCTISKAKLLIWLYQNEREIFSKKEINMRDLDDFVANENISFHIFQSDYLLKDFMKNRFDLIIGNPPYVENKKIIDKKYKEELYNRFQSAYKLFDLSVLFIEKAIKLLDNKSICSFILPNKFLSAEYGWKIREFILNNCQVKNIVNLSSLNLFNGISTYPLILTVEKSLENESNYIILEDFNVNHSIGAEKSKIKISQSLIRRLPKLVIPIEGKPELVLSIYNTFKRMEDVIDELKVLYRPYGFLKYHKYLKYISEEKSSEKDLILLGTSNVGKYHILFDKAFRLAGKKYPVSYFSKSRSNKKKIGDLGERKLIYREIAKKLTFSFDPGIFTNLTGLYFIIIPSFSEIQLFSLLGILNSSLMDLIFKTLYATLQMSGKYMRINGVFIKRLPIPYKIPVSIGSLSKINQFLNQFKYDFEKINEKHSGLMIKKEILIKEILPFFKDLTDSLVLLFYLSKMKMEVDYPNLSNLLDSKYEIPDIYFKYFLTRFDLKRYDVYNLEEIMTNFEKIKNFYKFHRNKNDELTEMKNLQNTLI